MAVAPPASIEREFSWEIVVSAIWFHRELESIKSAFIALFSTTDIEEALLLSLTAAVTVDPPLELLQPFKRMPIDNKKEEIAILDRE